MYAQIGPAKKKKKFDLLTFEILKARLESSNFNFIMLFTYYI